MRPCPVPAHPETRPERYGIEFSWDAIYGAYWYEAQTRIKSKAWPSDQSVLNAQDHHFFATWTADGNIWEFRVRTYCGPTLKSGWSKVVSGKARA